MSHEILIGLAGVLVLGILAQWLAWRLKLPSILMLLLFGLLAGPVTGMIHPDQLLGNLLLPMVSISVAVILFEGGMSLKIRDLREIGRDLGLLVTVGALISWVLTALAASWFMGFPTALAILTGAILVVTGPTVVLPLLRHVRPRGSVASLVKWEGILNDPVGAVLAVLVFEVMLAGEWGTGTAVVVSGILKTVGGGSLLGVAGAGVMILLLRFYNIPEYLESSFTLMMVVLVYTVSDLFQAESGLFSATIMGIVMANQRLAPVHHILEFKENLRVLLISSLFIFLAARLEVENLDLLGWGSLVFLAFLILIVRPASVFGATLRSGLGWREKVFLSWMAPRGIVAAAVSSVFALRLEEFGYPEGKVLAPLVFLVIVGTVAFYGLTATPVARWLGVSRGAQIGCLILGGHVWARKIAEALQKEDIPVLLVDNNRSQVSAARLAGIPSTFGNILDEDLPDRLPMDGLGKLLALTSNQEVNSLAALHFAEIFGRQEVYQLPPREEAARKDDYELSQRLRGRLLFGKDNDFVSLGRRFARGAEIKATTLSEEFDYQAFLERHGHSSTVLFVLEKENLKVITAEEEPKPEAGQTLIAVVDRPEG